MIVVFGRSCGGERRISFLCFYPILLDALGHCWRRHCCSITCSEWRRYPLVAFPHQVVRPTGHLRRRISNHALRTDECYVDIEFNDLLKLSELAKRMAKTRWAVRRGTIWWLALFTATFAGTTASDARGVAGRPRRPGDVCMPGPLKTSGQGRGASGGMCRLSTFITAARYPRLEAGRHRLGTVAVCGSSPKV